MLKINFIIVLLLLFICEITIAEQLNRIEGWHENEITNNTKEFIKVEFYDLTTNDTLLRLPFRQRRQPCSCLGYNCGCCAGMNIVQFGFNQKLCTNFTYDPYEFQLGMNVVMNDNSLYQNMVSARNPPPVCVPVPLPPIFPIMADMCFKFFNIFMPGRNMHMCLDMEARIQRAPVLVLHFDCMRMGQDGVAFVKPDEDGGLTGSEPSPGTHIDVDSPDPPSGVVDPPQTDYDIYDQIDEIKHKQ